MKANAFVSHMEFAKRWFRPNDLFQATRHLKGAQRAMEKIKQAKAEYVFSREGWRYVAEICKELGEALKAIGQGELVDAFISIHSWVLENEDRTGEGTARSILNNWPAPGF